MKAFIAACLILLLLVGGVTANAFFMDARLSEAAEYLLKLPTAPDEEGLPFPREGTELLALWTRTRKIAAVTVTAKTLENIDRAFDRLQVGWNAADDVLYEEARAELHLLLLRLYEMETFLLSSIM